MMRKRWLVGTVMILVVVVGFILVFRPWNRGEFRLDAEDDRDALIAFDDVSDTDIIIEFVNDPDLLLRYEYVEGPSGTWMNVRYNDNAIGAEYVEFYGSGEGGRLHVWLGSNTTYDIHVLHGGNNFSIDYNQYAVLDGSIDLYYTDGSETVRVTLSRDARVRDGDYLSLKLGSPEVTYLNISAPADAYCMVGWGDSASFHLVSNSGWTSDWRRYYHGDPDLPGTVRIGIVDSTIYARL